MLSPNWTEINRAPDWATIDAERASVGLPPAEHMTASQLDAEADARWQRLCEVMGWLRRRP